MAAISTHRTRSGDWVECLDPEVCFSPVHLDISVAEAQQIPEALIEPLFDAFDPPTRVSRDGVRFWHNSVGQIHRDWGLPAVIQPEESRFWYRRSMPYRDHDKPAIVFSTGSLLWFQNGRLHRGGNLPARTDPGGYKEWYRYGTFLRSEGGEPLALPYGWITG